MWYNIGVEGNTGRFLFANKHPSLCERPYFPSTRNRQTQGGGFLCDTMTVKDWHKRVYARPADRFTPMKREKYRELRKMCLERDGYKCYRCEKVSKTGQGLSAHHVIPRIDGGPDTLDNLITLCHPCHDYVEIQGFTTLFEIMTSADNPIKEREIKVVDCPETFDRPDWHKYVYGGMKRRGNSV